MAFCYKCGGRLAAGQAFCPGCGTPVDEKAAAQAAGEPAPVIAPAPPVVQPVYMYPQPQPSYYPPQPKPPKPKKQRPVIPQDSKIPFIAGIVMAAVVVFLLLASRFIWRLSPLSIAPGILFVVLAFTAGKKRPALFIIPFVIDAVLKNFFTIGGTLFTMFLAVVSIIILCLCLSGAIKGPKLRIALIGIIFAAALLVFWYSGHRVLFLLATELLTYAAYVLIIAGLKPAPDTPIPEVPIIETPVPEPPAPSEMTRTQSSD